MSLKIWTRDSVSEAGMRLPSHIPVGDVFDATEESSGDYFLRINDPATHWERFMPEQFERFLQDRELEAQVQELELEYVRQSLGVLKEEWISKLGG